MLGAFTKNQLTFACHFQGMKKIWYTHTHWYVSPFRCICVCICMYAFLYLYVYIDVCMEALVVIWLPSLERNKATRVQVPDGAVLISHGKDMNPIILPVAIGKL